MLIQTAKAQASDLEAIQNACRALRSDFENNTFAKPLEDAKSPGYSKSSKLGAAIDGGADGPGQLESMNKMFQELRDNLANLQDNVTSLAERSDLAVLLAKRAESIVQPVASIHGDMDSLDEEVTFVVNEHANRIMLYADMFLQLEVLIASKADGKQLQMLRDALAEFQNAGGMKMGEEVKATLKSHERMIMQLVEKVGILGKGLLIMAGQDPAHDPAVAMQQAMEQIAKAEEGQRLRRLSERAGTADAANAAASSVSFGQNPVSLTHPTAFAAPAFHEAIAGNVVGSTNQIGGITTSQAVGGGVNQSGSGLANQNHGSGGRTHDGGVMHDQGGGAHTSQGGGGLSINQGGVQGGGSTYHSSIEGSSNNHGSSGGGTVNQGVGGSNNQGGGTGRVASLNSNQVGGVHQSGDVIPLPADLLVNPQIETHRGTTFSATRAIQQEAGPGPHRTSSLRIRSVEEASRMVLGTKYSETLGALEDALNANMIEPKEDMMVLARLVRQMENVILDLERHLALIASLEEGLDAKADKIDLQRLEKLVRESKAVQNAMLCGRPLLGFKCMSCDHPLQRLNPLRAEHVPTGIMPKSYLSMLSAERIFANENVRREPSPPQSPPRTPPTAEMLRNAKGQQGGGDSARLRKTGMGGAGQGQQNPYNGSLPRRGSSAGKPSA
ncbi:unnamed protein product [Calypogeia fissa]